MCGRSLHVFQQSPPQKRSLRYGTDSCYSHSKHCHTISQLWVVAKMMNYFIIIIIFHTVQDTFSVYCVPGSTPVPQNPMNAMVMVMVKLILNATSPYPSPLHPHPSPLTPFPHPSYPRLPPPPPPPHLQES